jgi:endonuclease YncB( thermonuclease family)|tara:strand:- start:536 stop:745 length:210 start_codon:yes stop_codon:yes gene_type:complete
MSSISKTAAKTFGLILFFISIAQADITGVVVSVTDGDTIKVLDQNRVQHKVRLTGIDAPEIGQPFSLID